MLASDNHGCNAFGVALRVAVGGLIVDKSRVEDDKIGYLSLGNHTLIRQAKTGSGQSRYFMDRLLKPQATQVAYVPFDKARKCPI